MFKQLVHLDPEENRREREREGEGERERERERKREGEGGRKGWKETMASICTNLYKNN